MNPYLKINPLLKITSIILIICSSLSFLGAIFVLILGGSLTALIGSSEGLGGVGAFLSILLVIALLFSLFVPVLQFFAGIKGLKLNNNIGPCKILGFIMIVLSSISLIMNFASDSVTFLSFLNMILPVLYFLGVIRQEKEINQFMAYNNQNFNNSNNYNQNFNNSNNYNQNNYNNYR